MMAAVQQNNNCSFVISLFLDFLPDPRITIWWLYWQLCYPNHYNMCYKVITSADLLVLVLSFIVDMEPGVWKLVYFSHNAQWCTSLGQSHEIHSYRRRTPSSLILRIPTDTNTYRGRPVRYQFLLNLNFNTKWAGY